METPSPASRAIRSGAYPRADTASGKPGLASAQSVPWWVAIVVALAFLAVVPFLYRHAARMAIDRDPFVYAQTAKEMLAGRKLYSETWMDKPPLAFVFYAIPQIFVPRDYGAIAFFAAAIVVVQGLLFAWAFRSSPPAAAGCLIFMALYPLTDANALWPSTEQFSNLFVTGCVLIALRIHRQQKVVAWQCVAAGALAILAFHVRQNAVFCAIVPAVALLVVGRPIVERLRGVVLMGVGGLAGWAAMIGLAALLGDVHGYFWAVFVYPRAYAEGGDLAQAVQLSTRFWTSTLAVLWLIFGGLSLTRANAWLVVTTFAVGLGNCLVPLRSFEHYLVNSLPYIALLVGLGFQRIAAADNPLTWCLVGALAVTFLPTTVLRMYMCSQGGTYPQFLRVAEAVDRVAPPNATLLVCGPLPCEAIQFKSRLPAANVHEWMFQLRPPFDQMLPKSWDTIREEYLANPPGVIVIHRDDLQRANSPATPDETGQDIRLIRELVARYGFRPAATEGNYVIGIRDE